MHHAIIQLDFNVLFLFFSESHGTLFRMACTYDPGKYHVQDPSPMILMFCSGWLVQSTILVNTYNFPNPYYLIQNNNIEISDSEHHVIIIVCLKS